MHGIWCFGYDGITCEVHPTVQVDVGSGVVGQLFSNQFSENGRIIPISGKFSINGSVELSDIPDFQRTSGPMYTENLLSPHDTTGWGDGDNSNQNWGVQPGGPYSNAAMAWGTTVPECPDYMPRSPYNARAATCRVRDDWLCGRHRALMSSLSKSCNPVRNPGINRRGDDWEGLVDQDFFSNFHCLCQ